MNLLVDFGMGGKFSPKKTYMALLYDPNDHLINVVMLLIVQ